ncbi:hypothetical protein V4V48_004218 [Vibrio mimicus]
MALDVCLSDTFA